MGHQRVGRDGDADRSGDGYHGYADRGRPRTNGIAIGDAVWVTNSLDGSVSRIDPETLVVATFPTGGDDPQGVAVVGDAVWVAARGSAKIVRLDANTGQIRPSLAVGAPPQDVAPVGDGAAITTTTSRTEHRGGTLTIAGASEDGLRERPSVDPNSFAAWFPVVWDSLAVTNDGLVSLKRVPGPDGGTVVADLAKALPTVTDGGLTYAFQLREGIRYSTGRPVRAGDIRYGLERTFTVNARYYLTNQPPLDAEPYGAIVGAPKCLASPRSCDLSRGIVVDDKTGKITFHLRHPDPDFLAKLAMPLAAAIPPDAPRHDSGRHPLPATGPYVIIRYDIWQYVLVRNPYFHEWSPDAQPDGYPNRIVFRVYKKTSQAVSAVEHGAADWLYFALPSLNHAAGPRDRDRTTPPRLTHPSTPPPTWSLLNRLAVESRSLGAARDRIRHRPRQAPQCPEQRQQQRASAIDVPAGRAQLPRVSALLPLQARPYACSEARTPLAKLRQAGLGHPLRPGDEHRAGYFVDLLNSLGFQCAPHARWMNAGFQKKRKILPSTPGSLTMSAPRTSSSGFGAGLSPRAT